MRGPGDREDTLSKKGFAPGKCLPLLTFTESQAVTAPERPGSSLQRSDLQPSRHQKDRPPAQAASVHLVTAWLQREKPFGRCDGLAILVTAWQRKKGKKALTGGWRACWAEEARSWLACAALASGTLSLASLEALALPLICILILIVVGLIWSFDCGFAWAVENIQLFPWKILNIADYSAFSIIF